MRFNGIEAEALYHPPPLAGRYRDDGPGRYGLVVGRLDPWKRMDLAIEGAAAGRFPLVIAGSGPDEERLRKVAARTGADVDFRGAVSDEELLSLYAGCGVVLFTPADEDYGYIALEAFLSKKPVVTCTDSGGPLEFVVDGETGRVAAPNGAAVGAAAADLLAVARRRPRDGGEGVRVGPGPDVGGGRRRRSSARGRARVSVAPLGFVSPLPPVRSGIADYSADLLTALRGEVELVTYAPVEATRAFSAGHGAVLLQVGNDPLHRAVGRGAPGERAIACRRSSSSTTTPSTTSSPRPTSTRDASRSTRRSWSARTGRGDGLSARGPARESGFPCGTSRRGSGRCRSASSATPRR